MAIGPSRKVSTEFKDIQRPWYRYSDKNKAKYELKLKDAIFWAEQACERHGNQTWIYWCPSRKALVSHSSPQKGDLTLIAMVRIRLDGGTE